MIWDPTGQRVLVTGASSGIGAALAVELGRGGAFVGLAARRVTALNKFWEKCEMPGAMAAGGRWTWLT